ncbi:MAG: cysteine desulfurase family protein [Candidatus Poribacteria bacterium]|nr:cysteine desulfurase family protein [Candidatus Poribacteria bacterium]MDE0506085.1 cysteine desulfurase family protein [Candidatus Poribacteria bacterium]
MNSQDSIIYMDYHATTPIDPQVVDAMIPYLTTCFGNASSTAHLFGWKARDAVEKARHQVAELIGCSTDELIFTSGATESDNLAIKGVAYAYRHKGNHIITSTAEHHAVLDTCAVLENDGFKVTYLPVDKYGMVHPQQVRDCITEQTILISLIYANNEVGTINPLAEVGKIAGCQGVLFHSDAVQAVGKIDSDVNRLGLDLMSLTAHKMYGPKGIGALYIRARKPRIHLAPMIHGGGQENRIRPGTLNVPAIVGFGEACELSKTLMVDESERIAVLRDKLLHALFNRIDHINLNGHPLKRLVGNLNISFEFVESEALLASLDNIALSAGSACTSGAVQASHVLLAMRLKKELAHTAVRFGLGRFTTEVEVDQVIDAVVKEVHRLRQLSPLYEENISNTA